MDGDEFDGFAPDAKDKGGRPPIGAMGWVAIAFGGVSFLPIVYVGLMLLLALYLFLAYVIVYGELPSIPFRESLRFGVQILFGATATVHLLALAASGFAMVLTRLYGEDRAGRLVRPVFWFNAVTVAIGLATLMIP